MMHGRSNWKKFVVAALSLFVLILLGLVPTQVAAWRTTGRASIAPVVGSSGLRLITALVVGLLTLVLGFIAAWLLAWIVQLRTQRAQSDATWKRVLLGAGIIALLLIALLLSPFVDLTALRPDSESIAAAATLTRIAQLPSPTPYPTHTLASTYTPAPTYTAAPTYTPQPTYTAVPTWTPPPTATPTSTSTRTPIPTRTSTPTRTPTGTATAATTPTDTPAPPTWTSTPAQGAAQVTATGDLAPTATAMLSTLPITGTPIQQVVRVLWIVVLAVLLVGGGLWEARRHRRE